MNFTMLALAFIPTTICIMPEWLKISSTSFIHKKFIKCMGSYFTLISNIFWKLQGGYTGFTWLRMKSNVELVWT
jgi:hypothetical protein